MRRDDAYLIDMLLAARDAVEFASGLSYAQFERSRLHRNAILKAVETIGEAAARISVETKEAHSEIPWHEIVGMRNRLVHVYFDIDLGIVWQTVQKSLPALIVQLEPLAPQEDE